MELDTDKVWPGLCAPSLPGVETKKGPWTACNTKINYETTTGRAFRYSLQPEIYFERTQPELCRKAKIDDRVLNDINYMTTYKRNYTLKFSDEDVINKADVPAFRKFKFLKSFQEKLKTAPMHRLHHVSEYNNKYKPITQKSIDKGVVNNYDQFNCKIKSVTRNDQPRIDLKEDSVGKHQDIYVSQTSMDFHHKTPERLAALNGPVADYICSAFPAPPPLEKRKTADRFLFRTKERLVAPMVSVTKSDFVKMNKIDLPRMETAVWVPKMSEGAALSTPFMYHTEYSHIGRPWFSDIVATHEK